MSEWKKKERELNQRYYAGQHRVFHQSVQMVGIDKKGKPIYQGVTYRK